MKKFKSIDSLYIIIGVVLAITAILLNQFIWQSKFAFWSSLIGSVGIAFFLALKIAVEKEPEVFPIPFPAKPCKSVYGGRFVIGVALINFAVSLVAMAMLRVGGIFIGFLVWEVIMNAMEFRREKYPSPFFWIMIGFVMYLMSYTPALMFEVCVIR